MGYVIRGTSAREVLTGITHVDAELGCGAPAGARIIPAQEACAEAGLSATRCMG
jgi:hypothetical protein